MMKNFVQIVYSIKLQGVVECSQQRFLDAYRGDRALNEASYTLGCTGLFLCSILSEESP